MRTTGRVEQINVSPNGGVPKLRVPQAWLGFERVEGDKQRHLKFHGGPKRAVSLFSLELIEALQAEGHPIQPGTTGENLTIAGLDWEELKAGMQLQVGAALIEITAFARPCDLIAESFGDLNSKRIWQKEHPGWSRLYAKVLVEAEVHEGDTVEVLVNASESI